MTDRRPRRAALAMLALVLFAAPCATARIKFFDRDAVRGSGDLVTREVDLRAFEAIVLDGGLDIDVRVGPAQRVTALVDDNLVDNLVLEVENGALLVDWDKDCRPSGKCRLEIAVPSLRSIEVNGAGDITVEGLEGKSFDLRIDGAGDVELAGRVDSFDLSINGAGDVDARDLIAEEVVVSVSGAGDADVHAEESLVATVAGVGDVSYAGDPARTRIRTPGLGEVHRR